ncbi:hypothetical protein IQ247_07970 [Plectonema cf. radiosum LEGE 06105]|uniref:Uncharacterized protein n=1 Tax=Plectonema cf. radiosum LEGE 06105 TaxID=945769 RepID=A0A8J7EZ95_9CYAN|nr:hypothetical protein [Plectonema radiosum]MBE9212653.1 hypothetical protein [Plectonema cf. radiosum LEGE 06105]
MSVTKSKSSKAPNPFIGTWHIYEMEMWDEDYFNMEVQAYVSIETDKQGDFQFGLVSGSLDGDLEKSGVSERFAFTWEGQDEMDEASGSGWMQLINVRQVEGFIKLHLGDSSTFKAKRAK